MYSMNSNNRKEYFQKYREKRRDITRNYDNNYYKTNKPIIRQRQTTYYEENYDRICQRQKLRYWRLKAQRLAKANKQIKQTVSV